MKKYFVFLTIILGITASIYAQNINGRFSSSVYSFERFDTANISNTYFRAFQMLNLNINQGDFSLRTYLNLESELNQKLKDDPRLRFYNLYFEGRNIWNVLSFKLGRQPLYNVVAGGVFDGISVDLKKGIFKLNGYYGGNVPAYQELKLTENFNDNFILGGKLSAVPVENFQIGLGYIQKNFKPLDYEAARLGPELDPITVEIRNKSTQYEYAFADLAYELKNIFTLDSWVEYDVDLEELSKFEINGRYEQIKDLGISIYYNFREPKIRYNSIFSVFDYGNSQEIEIGADYKINNFFSILGRFGNVEYRDDNSQRFTVGLNTIYGSINYRKTLGYAGELDAVSIYSARSFLDGLLTPSLGLSLTAYKLSEDSEKNNLTTILAGVNVRPFRTLSFDVQGQFMDNKIYKNDFRLFLKINYWFNTNLNLM